MMETPAPFTAIKFTYRRTRVRQRIRESGACHPVHGCNSRKSPTRQLFQKERIRGAPKPDRRMTHRVAGLARTSGWLSIRCPPGGLSIHGDEVVQAVVHAGLKHRLSLRRGLWNGPADFDECGPGPRSRSFPTTIRSPAGVRTCPPVHSGANPNILCAGGARPGRLWLKPSVSWGRRFSGTVPRQSRLGRGWHAVCSTAGGPVLLTPAGVMA